MNNQFKMFDGQKPSMNLKPGTNISFDQATKLMIDAIFGFAIAKYKMITASTALGEYAVSGPLDEHVKFSIKKDDINQRLLFGVIWIKENDDECFIALPYKEIIPCLIKNKLKGNEDLVYYMYDLNMNSPKEIFKK